MKEVSIIGIDLAKHVFQLHGATAEGEVMFRKKLSRMSCCRFRGHEDKIVTKELESGYDETEVQR